MNTTETARAYADRIMAMAVLPEDCKTDVSSLLFLAYMRGWSDAAKDEMEWNRYIRTGNRGDAA